MKYWICITTLALASTLCAQNTKPPKSRVVTETYIAKYVGPVDQKTWNQHGQHGQIVKVMNSGVVITENYLNGKLHGATTHSFPNRSTPQTTFVHRQGELVEHISHYPSGRNAHSEQYGPNNSVTIKEWYRDGSLRSQESYQNNTLQSAQYFDSNRLQEGSIDRGNGERVIRDHAGLLQRRESYQNGTLVQHTAYHTNGEPKELASFSNGQLHGERKIYDVGGVPLSIETWRNGKQEGLTTHFHNGEPIARVAYKNNKKHGVERIFQEDQSVVQEIHWKEGLRHGPSTMYVDDNGYTQWYFNGRKVNKTTFDIFTGGRRS